MNYLAKTIRDHLSEGDSVPELANEIESNGVVFIDDWGRIKKGDEQTVRVLMLELAEYREQQIHERGIDAYRPPFPGETFEDIVEKYWRDYPFDDEHMRTCGLYSTHKSQFTEKTESPFVPVKPTQKAAEIDAIIRGDAEPAYLAYLEEDGELPGFLQGFQKSTLSLLSTEAIEKHKLQHETLREWRANKEKFYEENRFKFTEFFLMDSWSTHEGLMFLNDIDPTGAEIEWDYENYMGALIDSPKIHNANLLSTSGSFYDIPCTSHIHQEIEEVMQHEAKGYRPEVLLDDPEVIRKDKILKTVTAQLAIAKKIWDSNLDHTKDRYPVSYILEWAEAKGIYVPWKDWAIEHDFWPLQKTTEPQQEESPKRTKTLLMMLAGAYKASGIDWNERGIAQKIQAQVDKAGGEIKELQTIRNALKEIDSALN